MNERPFFLLGGGGFILRKTNVSLENEWLENVCPILK